MRKQRLFLLATTVGLLLCGSAARADEAAAQPLTPLQKMIKQAMDALQGGQYKRAEQTWLRTVKTMDDNGQKDQELGNALKHLGETYLKEQKYGEAEAALKRSQQIFDALGTPDQELTQDLSELAKSYRAVDFSSLGKDAADALKEANCTSMGMTKTDTGNHVQMALPARYTKKVDDSPDVDQVGLEKVVTFDIEEAPDGTIKISNIKGVKVHAKLWVSVDQSVFKKNEAGERIADVTASKMGISKTVSSKLPNEALEPIDGLVKNLHDFSNPLTETASTTTSSPTTATTTTTTSTTSAGQATASSGATTTTTVTSSTTSTTSSTTAAATPSAAPGSDAGTIKPVNYEPVEKLPAPGATPTTPSD